MTIFLRFMALTLAVTLSACAQVPTDPIDRAAYDANNDPLEPMNRAIFDVNLRIDHAVIRPVALAYRDNVPVEIQTGISNLGSNLREPLFFINSLLQARPNHAGRALARFATNSTLGIGGLFDVATTMDIKRVTTDFGQTLYVWGVVDDGPYLILPLYGPSNLRDAFGMGVDSAINPVGLVSRGSLTRSILDATGDKEVLDNGNAQFEFVQMGISILSVIDLRARYADEFDELERSSLDFYAKWRSVNRQRRDAALGKPRANQSKLSDPMALVDPGP